MDSGIVSVTAPSIFLKSCTGIDICKRTVLSGTKLLIDHFIESRYLSFRPRSGLTVCYHCTVYRIHGKIVHPAVIFSQSGRYFPHICYVGFAVVQVIYTKVDDYGLSF